MKTNQIIKHPMSWKSKIIRFLAAQTISLFGSSLAQYAIIWHITLFTSSGKMLAISTLCGFLPQILAAFFSGVLIDRYDRKKIIMLSDGVIALSTLVLAAAFLSGRRNISFLFAALIIRSAGTGVQTPAVNAIIPQIAPQEHLMRINGVNSTLSSLMMFLSPAASGAILTFAPLEAALFIDVVTAVIGVGLTAAIPIARRKHPDETKFSAGKEAKEGYLYIKRTPIIKQLLLYQVVLLILISPSAFLTPLMVSRTFGGQIWRFSASEMTYSCGMVLGGVLITAWGGFQNRLHTTIFAGTIYGVLMIGLGLALHFPIYLILNMMIGVASPCYNTPITVFIQEKTDSSMHGRIFGLMQIASSCALPFGMLIFGPLSDVIRIQRLLVFSGFAAALLSICLRMFGRFEIHE